MDRGSRSKRTGQRAEIRLPGAVRAVSTGAASGQKPLQTGARNVAAA